LRPSPPRARNRAACLVPISSPHEKRGRTAKAQSPAGPYSQSARIGQVIAAAGQGCSDSAMGELAADDVASQTRQALANVETALAANGTSMDDVIRVGVFLTDVEDFSAMNEVYRQAYSEPFLARSRVYD
jgi:2-iminobutanoate/2-iminopropanoate deaminase